MDVKNHLKILDLECHGNKKRDFGEAMLSDLKRKRSFKRRCVGKTFLA